MKKEINSIVHKLDKTPISSLTAREISVYFEHRLDTILQKKKVLVRDELEYLLSETGPGNRRMDPELLSHLIKTVPSSQYGSIPEIERIQKQKETFEKYLLENKNSEDVQHLFSEIIKNNLKDVKIESSTPFIISGTFNKISVACLIKNGEWILPSKELFSFLIKCQKEKVFPVIIAKKISGILFPVFKGLSVLGLNLYKVYLSKNGEKLINKIGLKEKPFEDIHYNNQFNFVGSNQDETINAFFENTISNYIQSYYDSFLKSKIDIKDNFIDTVSQFRKNKSSKGLIENYENKMTLIAGLEQMKSF
jgi:hypothetical protein